MNRKLAISLTILLSAIFATFLLWRWPLLLSVLLVVIAYAKHRLYPIKSELLWFCLIFIGGAVVEIFHVNVSRAWSYSSSQIFNIPIWIPLLWGVVGTNLIVFYDALIEGLTQDKK